MIDTILLVFLVKQLQATRDNLSRKTEEAENKLKESEAEKARLEKELKESKQLATKHQNTLKELRLGVNVMLRSILNEVKIISYFSTCLPFYVTKSVPSICVFIKKYFCLSY